MPRRLGLLLGVCGIFLGVELAEWWLRSSWRIPMCICPGYQLMERVRSAHEADRFWLVALMVRRPAHSGKAAVARLPRSGRHGVATAAGLSKVSVPKIPLKSLWTDKSKPPGPYQTAASSNQPRDPQATEAAQPALRSPTSTMTIPEESRPRRIRSKLFRVQSGQRTLNRGCRARATDRGLPQKRRGKSLELRICHGCKCHDAALDCRSRVPPSASLFCRL